MFQHGRVLLFDRCGDAFDVLFLFLFRFEPEQFRLHLNHLCFGGLGYGIDFLHRFDQFAVTAQVSFFAEYEDGFYGDDRDRVAVGPKPARAGRAAIPGIGKTTFSSEPEFSYLCQDETQGRRGRFCPKRTDFESSSQFKDSEM